MPRVVIAGAIAAKPGNAGNAWSRLAWVEGFRRLDWDVTFVERLPHADATARTWFAQVHDWAEDSDWHLLTDEADSAQSAQAFADADVILNISGHLPLAAVRASDATTVFLDDDPGFTQMWAAQGLGCPDLLAHDVHVTFGGNLGRSDCPVPTLDVKWHAVQPPVATSAWLGDHPLLTGNHFTTVASWRGPYAPIELDGVSYGRKVHEFRKLYDVPERAGVGYAVALDIDAADGADAEAMQAHGWRLDDPRKVVGTLESYRNWVRASIGEFSAVQGMYATSRCGWFSDRSACYLASGRPVVLQSTGSLGRLPVGEGLLTFSDADGAVAALRDVVADYDRHAKAACDIAAMHFDPAAAAATVATLAMDKR